MTVARNPLADLEAIAAMPGLEEMALAVDPNEANLPDTLALMIILAGQWTVGSRNELTSLFRFQSGWTEVRASAARVGRDLSVRPPSHDKLRHRRESSGPGMGQRLARALPAAMAPLVRSVGLLPSDRTPNLAMPARANTVYGDGTLFKPLSGVGFDSETGEITGSRSTGVQGPRLPVNLTAGTDSWSTQLPIALVGAHGGERWQRVVLAVDLYPDYNETGAAMDLFRTVHAIYGESLHAFIYDRLMRGGSMREIMQHGVVPLVDMQGASPTAPGVNLPDELRFLCGRKGLPKDRAQILRLENVSHPTGATDCVHAIWALDGTLVTCHPGDMQPSVDSIALGAARLRFEEGPGGARLIGSYRIPCRSGHVPYELDLTGFRRATSGNQREVADFVRAVDSSGALDTVRGYRSDVESAFRTVKGQLQLHGRAGSLQPDHFLADVVGAALWINATAWDVHSAQHTKCGQVLSESLARARARERARSGTRVRG